MIDVRRDKAVWALLIEKFGLRTWEIGKLTDRQISELYFHPRDKDGVIIFPGDEVVVVEEVPDSLDVALMKLESVRAMMKPQDYLRAAEEIKRAYERQHDGVDRPPTGDPDDGG